MAKPKKTARLRIKSDENTVTTFLKKNAILIESTEFLLVVFFVARYLNERIRYQQALVEVSEYETIFGQLQAQINTLINMLTQLFGSVSQRYPDLSSSIQHAWGMINSIQNKMASVNEMNISGVSALENERNAAIKEAENSQAVAKLDSLISAVADLTSDNLIDIRVSRQALLNYQYLLESITGNYSYITSSYYLSEVLNGLDTMRTSPTVAEYYPEIILETEDLKQWYAYAKSEIPEISISNTPSETIINSSVVVLGIQEIYKSLYIKNNAYILGAALLKQKIEDLLS